MNHWFLVGRDLMWFCLAYTPIYLTTFSWKANDPDVGAFILYAALALQTAGIACLYYGVIR